jgi:dye decolorizing peroxidase
VTVNRRSVLAAGAGALAGAAAGAGAMAATATKTEAQAEFGTATIPFHGPHQAGVTNEPPAHGTFVAFTLPAGTDRRALAG